jgi:excisionase family DNA binding protein
MTGRKFYSPAEVSHALGVSATTIKRWVDAGVLPAHKTAGGHRKILRADVLRVVHEGNFPQLDLSRLNFVGLPKELTTEKLSQRLFDALRAGDSTLTRSLIHGACAAGMAIEELGDAVIAPAMSLLGHEWEHGRIDVMHEHRSTLLLTAVLHEQKPALEATAEKDRPVAVGGNPEGDHSVLASLLIELMLLNAGWESINLGPNTPLASFRVAISELKPRLVWLSVSYLPDPQKFHTDYGAFYDQALAAGVALAAGGQAIQNSVQGVLPATCYGSCLSDLAKFARTLHPRPRPPKRGRPCSKALQDANDSGRSCQ